MVPAIVHLIGFPASGKLTVANALAAHWPNDQGRFVVLDNHHTSNVIFAALNVDGVTPLPLEVWDRVREVREALLRTIEELSPPDWSFVFTNVLTDDKPGDRAIVERLRAVAERTSRVYLPVLLQCEPDTLLARVANPDRKARSKWIDPPAVRAFAQTGRLVDISDLEPLVIDTGAHEPSAAARLILEALRA